MIQKPQSVKRLENGSVVFYDLYGKPIGTYILRGGFSFPAVYPSEAGAKVEGYICLAAQDTKTKVTHIIEEMEFLSVDHIIDDQQNLIQEGIAMFLSSSFTRYGAIKWYWNQDEDIASGWRVKIYRSSQVQPQPQCIKVHWRDDRTAMGTVFSAFANGQLKGTKGSGISGDVIRMKAMPDMNMIPAALWSLMCVVNGMNKYPWRDRSGSNEELMR